MSCEKYNLVIYIPGYIYIYIYIYVCVCVDNEYPESLWMTPMKLKVNSDSVASFLTSWTIAPESANGMDGMISLIFDY